MQYFRVIFVHHITSSTQLLNYLKKLILYKNRVGRQVVHKYELEVIDHVYWDDGYSINLSIESLEDRISLEAASGSVLLLCDTMSARLIKDRIISYELSVFTSLHVYIDQNTQFLSCEFNGNKQSDDSRDRMLDSLYNTISEAVSFYL